MPAFKLSDGDLAVRKFFRPEVLRHTGVSRATTRGLQREFLSEDGEAMWEYDAELRKPRLYAVLHLPDRDRVVRRAHAIRRVACARLGMET